MKQELNINYSSTCFVIHFIAKYILLYIAFFQKAVQRAAVCFRLFKVYSINFYRFFAPLQINPKVIGLKKPMCQSNKISFCSLIAKG